GGASASNGAAGIGGGSCSAGPVVTVLGSTTTVAAAGTGGGAGIGGGSCSLSVAGIDGGTVTVGAGSAVSVLSDTGTAIGGSDGGAFGALSNAGTITLASPLIIPAGVAVSNDGTLVVSDSIANAGTIAGTGTIS